MSHTPPPARFLNIESIPPEILLRIFLYLDVPDLAALIRTSHGFRAIALDQALHRVRLRVVAPSRVQHALEPNLRPTVADLCQRNLMRGLGIERRWRAGLYFASSQSVKQFENSQRLQQKRVRDLLCAHIRSRPAAFNLVETRILPDVESANHVDRSLLPIMRKLKFAIQRDVLARQVRAQGGIGAWLEARGRMIEGERVRLAICPGVRKVVRFWESLASS